MAQHGVPFALYIQIVILEENFPGRLSKDSGSSHHSWAVRNSSPHVKRFIYFFKLKMYGLEGWLAE